MLGDCNRLEIDVDVLGDSRWSDRSRLRQILQRVCALELSEAADADGGTTSRWRSRRSRGGSCCELKVLLKLFTMFDIDTLFSSREILRNAT